MALQINQYTKTRTSGTITPEDLMDFDSTDDVGVSYESAKISVADFLSYVNANANNIYGADGTIIANRTLSAGAFWTKWNDGDVKIDHLGEANSYGFVVEFGGVEMGRYGYAQAEQSASIVLDYFVGIAQTNFFKAVDGQVGIMQDTPTEVLHVGNNAADTYKMLLENTSGNVELAFTGMTMSRGGFQYIKSSLSDGLSSLSLGSLATEDYNSIIASFTENFAFRNGNTNSEFARFDSDFNRFAIGTNVPSHTFHLVGTMRMVDGNQSNGYVMTCDANGVGSWQVAGGGADGNGIYDGSGSLTAATVVDMATNTADLGFTTTGGGANSLFIDDSLGNIGMQTGTPDASALLDLTSTTQGLLIPRMTAAQAELITKVDGLMIYSTSTSDVFPTIGFWGVVVNVWTKLDNV